MSSRLYILPLLPILLILHHSRQRSNPRHRQHRREVIMGSSDIALDLKLCAMKSANDLILSPSGDTAGGALQRVVDYIHRLEEEKQKIEAFKRELPLSSLLVSHVLEYLRDVIQQCRGDATKDKFEGGGGAISEKDNKMSWMSSVQLWSDHNCTGDSSKETKIGERDRSIESKPPKAGGGGAFVPFKRINEKKEDKQAAAALPELSLVPSAAAAAAMKNLSRVVPDVHEDNRSAVKNPRASGSSHLNLQSQQLTQQTRKARRCWSPELHRRFVLALQQLGGAQVATPKQIRDLMKVDGLTNDEVKSHLQKYRLHTRRMPNSTASSIPNKPVVWFGGLWPSQEQLHTTTSQQSGSQSESPQGPLQLNPASAGAVSLTAGDSYEEEDGKSESCSWK